VKVENDADGPGVPVAGSLPGEVEKRYREHSRWWSAPTSEPGLGTRRGRGDRMSEGGAATEFGVRS